MSRGVDFVIVVSEAFSMLAILRVPARLKLNVDWGACCFPNPAAQFWITTMGGSSSAVVIGSKTRKVGRRWKSGFGESPSTNTI